MTKKHWRAIIAVQISVLSAYAIFSLFDPPRFGTDSALMVSNASHGSYDDWRSPFLSWLWNQLLLIKPGDTSALLLSLLIILSSGLAFLGSAFTAALPLVIMAPPTIGMFGLVEKDVWMGSLLILTTGIALIPRIRTWTPIIYYSLVLSVITLAIACRLNAVIAAFPLMSFFLLQRGASLIKSWLVGALLIIIIAVSSRFVTQTVFHPTPRYISAHLILYDIAALELATGIKMLPTSIRKSEGFSEDRLREQFDPTNCERLFFSQDSAFFKILRTMNWDLLKALISRWLSSIATHPITYLQHRVRVSAALLGLPSRSSPVQSTKERPAAILHHLAVNSSIIFAPWLWHLLGAMLFASVLTSRRTAHKAQRLIKALLSSAFLYTGSFFILANSPHYRYLWWSHLAICIALMIKLSDYTRYQIRRHQQAT